MNEKERETLFNRIQDAKWMGWITQILSPSDISGGMLGKQNYNLNMMSHDTAIMLIRKALELGVRVKEVYVDTVGLEEIYEKKLSEIFPGIKVRIFVIYCNHRVWYHFCRHTQPHFSCSQVTVRSKADSLFPVVSAASICAKVVRDRVLESWTYREQHMRGDTTPMGCG